MVQSDKKDVMKNEVMKIKLKEALKASKKLSKKTSKKR